MEYRQPLLHTAAGDELSVVDKESDIQVELFACLEDHTLRLFRSSYTHRQETLTQCPSIVAEPDSIRREVLLHGCDPEDALKPTESRVRKIRAKLKVALNDVTTNWTQFTFASVREMRQIAHELEHDSGLNQYMHGDSQRVSIVRRLSPALQIFVRVAAIDSLRIHDVVAVVSSLQRLTNIALEVDMISIQFVGSAEGLWKALTDILTKCKSAAPVDSDYARLLADLRLTHAELMNKLGRGDEALHELDTTVTTYRAIHDSRCSEACRAAYVAALQRAISKTEAWNLQLSSYYKQWTDALSSEVGPAIAAYLLNQSHTTSPPSWLTPITLKYWPTNLVHSSALRYALHLPVRWIQRPLVRGTDSSLEHIYWGNATQGVEWLCIEVMDNVQQGIRPGRGLTCSWCLQTHCP